MALKTLFCSCDKDVVYDFKDVSVNTVSFKKNAKIDSKIDESSGLAHATDSTYFTHNDGPDNRLYEMTLNGVLKNTFEIKNASFIDFEDIAENDSTLFLGDIGNNSNLRKSLNIYIVERKTLEVKDTIQFNYKNQTKFPPDQENKNFDCEALIYANDSIFMVSKNRGFKLLYLYGIPARGGNYQLKPIDSLYLKAQVTGADISPDQKKMALLAYGKIYIFELTNGVKLNNPFICIKFPQSGQVEGILFLDNKTLIITNEAGKIFKAYIK